MGMIWFAIRGLLRGFLFGFDLFCLFAVFSSAWRIIFELYEYVPYVPSEPSKDFQLLSVVVFVRLGFAMFNLIWQEYLQPAQSSVSKQ